MEVSKNNYHFSGWATKYNIHCSDGRTIMPGAFAHCDGKIVPMVWNHDHKNMENVIGHALLHSCEEGMYAYGLFNDTTNGQLAHALVQNGDIRSLSIYANRLKHTSNKGVLHGEIHELSLVYGPANPGAIITSVIQHGDTYEDCEDEAVIHSVEGLELYHAEEKEDDEVATENKKPETNADDETVGDVMDRIMNKLDDTEKAVFYGVIGQAMSDSENNKEDDSNMKHNAFDTTEAQGSYLSHSDEQAIIELAKSRGGMRLQDAIKEYVSDTLKHGFVDEEGNEAIDQLFPEYELLKKGAPETIERDQTWVDGVMSGVHKSPISRIRTRFADARAKELRAKGYNDRTKEKTIAGNVKLINRTTDPQTVYRKDAMHRDDIIDITDFDVVGYQWNLMKRNLKEELAMAIMVGDQREEGDTDKISEEHIRPIWTDDELFTIHADVDIEAARQELQGSNTSAHFGENYIYAEAIITAALYSREKYKGQGGLEFYCTPHLLNVMLLARDLNGRRIYDSKTDLAAALNVKAIHTVEQFEGLTRTTKDGKTKKLLGLFVNLSDYQLGCTKGGEITQFTDFDIDFNSYKYLIETRLSGAMVNLFSAIALEEPVEGAAG